MSYYPSESPEKIGAKHELNLPGDLFKDYDPSHETRISHEVSLSILSILVMVPLMAVVISKI